MAQTRDHQAMEKRRHQAAAYFHQGLSNAEVARRLQTSRQSAGRWRATWRHGGKAALKSKGKAGCKSRLSVLQTRKFVAALEAGPLVAGHATDLWTLPRVADLIRKLSGQRYHPGHCWHLLRQLGFSCQRPTRRAIERDEPKILGWKRSTWPALKKKPARKAAPLSLSTKAA
jgi:putative transposase